ncbi:medium chain dehydrogenase/reductase family protein [Nocardiopsis changdeensis]|uniref:Zinc-binding dehydrogenase n=1 Tax=Nocardiopsis changdeensis TaxID=2831969 RepID=A0ABX8BJB1_9ACTN|nr:MULTISPECIES: medium chain dehydrogenase/reductase family protein [Nocardiopsis]QUX22340.1 zinc-binding dehydrogenase [Nocardiopsis changdeensis]QYX38281.1 medium chain dehydrogenase/reductase family protein [Nocardiopsis sp. MT53]
MTATGHTARTTLEAVLHGPGAAEEITLRRRTLEPLAPGGALVRVEATGVSFAEQQMRRGKYYDQPPFPFVPGYDLVGRVEEVGPGADPALVGRRVAALTKTGGWADRVALPAADLVPVPDGVDPADAEAAVVNGVTAYRMLHRLARVRRGDTVVVLGANGGVGSLLVQMARRAGATVVGTASARHLEAVRVLGALPVDRRDPDMYARIRELAPDGADAVFDHVGGPAITDSFQLLAPGGTLVSYGTAATRDEQGNARMPVLALFGRLLLWNALPNRRGAHFFNLWQGHRSPERYRRLLAEDLGAVFALLAEGAVAPPVAARVPLEEIDRAIALAESGTVVGKVVVVPAGRD